MSKTKILLFGATCAFLTIDFYMMQNMTFMWPALLLTVVFLSTWTAKYRRDQRIMTQARLKQDKTDQISHTNPPMSSEGSRRLFAPPPLKDK